jgi:magnesium chelatase family protein
LNETVLLGELGLDGSVKPIAGILAALISAKKCAIKKAIIPFLNLPEAKLLSGIEIIAVNSLSEVVTFLNTGAFMNYEIDNSQTFENSLDMSEVVGQKNARDLMEISAIGGHNILLIGPPGTGKTMLAERLPSILPPLEEADSLEVAAIHSVAGLRSNQNQNWRTPPFISPHHTATSVAMIGGGSKWIKPGAISLAHNGVLFIDEAPECARGVLDSLRQPLESGEVLISRAVGNIKFPAQFQLVLAANPCPCGKFSGRGSNCICTQLSIRKYLQKISGPLLDRIDLRVFVETPTRVELANQVPNEGSEDIRTRVIKAREIAKVRFGAEKWSINSQIPSQALRGKYRATKSAMAFLHKEIESERLSARGFHRVLRVAWSFADKHGHDIPIEEDVALAYQSRNGAEFLI